jgi:hypothetical protein
MGQKKETFSCPTFAGYPGQSPLGRNSEVWDGMRLEQRCSLEKNRLAGLPLNEIKSKEFGRDTDQRNLPGNVVYRMNGVHLYADILNLTHTLHVTEAEGETCHRRTLRFLNPHYRAVYHTCPDTPVGNPFS